MGLPAYTGPIEFKERWREAMELNGIGVHREEGPSELCREEYRQTEQPFRLTRGESQINCLEILSAPFRQGTPSPPPCGVVITELMGSAGSDESRELLTDIHLLFLSSGATVHNMGIRGVLFVSELSKPEFVEVLVATLHERKMHLDLPDTAAQAGMRLGKLRLLKSPRKRGVEIRLGETVDANTGKQYTLIAIRKPPLLARLPGRSQRRIYRAASEVLQRSPFVEMRASR